MLIFRENMKKIIIAIMISIFSSSLSPCCCSLKKCLLSICCCCREKESKLREEFETLTKTGTEILSRDESKYDTENPTLSDNIKALTNLYNRSYYYEKLQGEINSQIKIESFAAASYMESDNDSITALSNIKFDPLQQSFLGPSTPRIAPNPFLQPATPKARS